MPISEIIITNPTAAELAFLAGFPGATPVPSPSPTPTPSPAPAPTPAPVMVTTPLGVPIQVSLPGTLLPSAAGRIVDFGGVIWTLNPITAAVMYDHGSGAVEQPGSHGVLNDMMYWDGRAVWAHSPSGWNAFVGGYGLPATQTDPRLTNYDLLTGLPYSPTTGLPIAPVPAPSPTPSPAPVPVLPDLPAPVPHALSQIAVPAGCAPNTGNRPVPAAPATTPSDIGPDVQPLLANAIAGSTITLPPGTFKGCGAITAPNVTVQGTLDASGKIATILDATGFRPIHSQSVIYGDSGAVGGTLTVKNLIITGAAISKQDGSNASAVRGFPGVKLHLVNCEITGNQEGLLNNDDTTIEGCNFHGNGDGSGQTHNIYASDGMGSLTLINTISQGAIEGHACKSRAKITTITGSTLACSDGNALDLPDGGAVSVVQSQLVIPPSGPNALNTQLIRYASESTTIPGQITLNACEFNCAQNGAIQNFGSNPVIIKNPVYVGIKPTLPAGTVEI